MERPEAYFRTPQVVHPNPIIFPENKIISRLESESSPLNIKTGLELRFFELENKVLYPLETVFPITIV